MAHKKVRRGSIEITKWMELVFNQIKKFIIKEKVPVGRWRYKEGNYDSNGYVWENDFSEISEGDVWGGPNVTAMFNSLVDIPKSLEGETIYFYMHTAGEVMVSENGRYIGGLDPNRKYFKLLDSDESVRDFNIILEAFTRSKPDDDRNVDVNRHLTGCVHYFETPSLITIDEDFLNLFYDLKAIYDLATADLLEEDTRKFLLYHLEELLKLFPFYNSEKKAFEECLPNIKDYIENKIYSASKYMGKKGNIALVAHSHLDIAYHWTVDHSIQKNARTTIIQLGLMDKYPEFKYAHTQAFVYEGLERCYPELFKKVQEKVAEGRWEIVGGMYVEPDCNLISAESLARQVLYGKNYFKENFNIECDNAWLPDVFGNSPIMPQILKESEIDYFVTHKLSVWNDTNKFPYSNFIWKGLDGSEIKACIPPIHFVTWMDPDETIKNWKEFKSKEHSSESLQIYGYGDGGSGATEEMLELYKRQEKLPGIPNQRITTGKEFLEKSFEDSHDMPVWDGDLYLEAHRGTFTSKGKMKKYNRSGEFESQTVEALSTTVSILNGISLQKEIEGEWKKLLLNQFHDILPGSHTHPVGIEAIETYEEMFEGYRDIREKLYSSLDIKSSEDEYFTFNGLSEDRNHLVYINKKNWCEEFNGIEDSRGNIYPVQKQFRADGEEVFAAKIEKIKGTSLNKFKGVKTRNIDSGLLVSKKRLENDFFIVDLDDRGNIVSLYDKKRKKNVNKKGEILNKWVMYEDKPGALNVWDIVRTYKNQYREILDWENIKVIEDGPLSVALQMEKEFSSSKATQIIRLHKDKPQVDFDVWVDWKEEEKLLKTYFPVDIRSRVYTTDTSAGGFDRMNHKNTSWEQGAFEVPCQKFIDLSGGRFGVSIINESKYGCSVEDNTISLSLLKAGIYPDSTADQEEHRFSYSIYTHDGSYENSELNNLAYDFNAPLFLEKGELSDEYTPFELEDNNLQLQAFKLAEDGSGDIILRIAEVHGDHGTAKIKFNFKVDSISRVNILERYKSEVNYTDTGLELEYKQNEIISLRIKR